MRNPMSIGFVVRSIAIVAAIYVAGDLIVRFTLMSPAAVVFDEKLSWRHKPYATVFNSEEGWAVNTVNSMGFNDHDLAVDEQMNNVLVLGDSFTEAFQVSQSDNFTSVAERQLGCIEVINAGRSGLSPVQYSVVADRFLEETPASKLVIALTAGDFEDIRANEALLTWDTASGRITDITLNENKLYWLRKRADVVFQYSALATYMKFRARTLINNVTSGDGPAVIDQSQADADTRKVREVLTYTFNTLNARLPLVAIYIPELHFLPDGQVESLPESLSFELLAKQVAEDVGIPFVSTRPVLAESYRRDYKPPFGFANSLIKEGHLNEKGHQVVGDTLASLVGSDCDVNSASLPNS